MVDNKKITTFHQDIKPLFIDKDRNCMKGSFDLYKYNDVRNNAKKIYASLQNSTNPMPPGRPWSKEKIEKFKEWMDTGMVEGIPSEREAFYKLMNIEGFPEFLPIAKEMAREYLEKAEMIATDPPPAFEEFGKFLKLFKFTQKDFDKRLEDMYTFIEKAGKVYSPANDHIYNSREDVIERIRQWAPFNQTDGAWLRNAVKIGPTDEITSILSEILQDELGNGKTELNHSTLYTTLLATCGIHLPKVHQEAYAWDSKFLDSAFSAPTFALCISQFSDMFFPEILGITLMIEWTVLESVPIIKLFKYYGLDSHFYEMHVAIDNASTGHGAKAKRAIELYLDDIRQIGGEEGVQETWKRIWIGFVALWSTGTLATDLKRKIGLKTFGIPTFSDRMIEMISHKALYASRNHNNRKFEGKDLNQWFHEPKEFLEALANSSYIVKGDPESSPILTHLTTWDGPMYKVFTEDELNLWRDWIRSLGDFAIPPPEFNFNIVTEMKRLIKTLKNNQYGQLGHSHLLTGPNPDKPNEIITKNISWWLEQDDPTWVMKALSCDKNENPMVKPGDPATSPFITRLMSPANKMGSAFANIAISHGPMKSDFPGGAMVYLPESWNWRDIAYKWIEVGCPLDEQSSKSIISQPEDLLNVKLLYEHHTGIIKHHRHGPGCIH